MMLRLDRTKDRLKENWILHIFFGIYVIAIFLVIRVHEKWADEAQAWLLARDSGLFELLFKNLRYEGHPPLWYLILLIPSKILPYSSISFISALIAISGVYILIYRSCLPKIIKLLFPFTYFIFYQYGVIARSYVLIPLLLFLTARIYEDKVNKIYGLTILSILLANTSVFTMLVAICIMFIHFLDLLKIRHFPDKQLLKKQIIGYVVFAMAIGLIVIQLWQPKDSSFANRYNFSIKRFFDLGPRVLNESMTEISYLTIIVLLISLVWFWHKKTLLIYILPTLSVLGLFSIKYYNSWHQGIIFLIWLFAMWISFGRQDVRNIPKIANWIRIPVVIILLIVAGLQIYWSVRVSISDYHGTYSAGQATANYIKNNGLEDKKIYASTFWTTAVLPFFHKNIFANHNNGNKPCFWLWSKNSARMDNLDAMIKDQPDLIIIGRPAKDLKIPGYKLVGIFEGNLYWKTGIKEKNDFGLFLKSGDSQ